MDNSIRFNCVGCGIELEAPKEIVGVHVRCDQCDTKQAVLYKNQTAVLSQKKTKKSSFKVSKTRSKRIRKNKQKKLVSYFTKKDLL